MVGESLKVETGVKETLEVLVSAEKMVALVADILSDGKLNLGDLQILATHLRDIDTHVQAVKGISQVDDEIKNLDAAETMLIVAAAYKIAKAVASIKVKKGIV